MRLEDRMDSYFLSETLKYLYLLFDPHNPWVGQPPSRQFSYNNSHNNGKVEENFREIYQKNWGAGNVIFTTEGHPLSIPKIRKFPAPRNAKNNISLPPLRCKSARPSDSLPFLYLFAPQHNLSNQNNSAILSTAQMCSKPVTSSASSIQNSGLKNQESKREPPMIQLQIPMSEMLFLESDFSKSIIGELREKMFEKKNAQTPPEISVKFSYFNGTSQQSHIFSATPSTFGAPVPGPPRTLSGSLFASHGNGCENISSAFCSRIAGGFVIVERGDCLFFEKVLNFQACGVLGVVIQNNKPKENSFLMSGNGTNSGSERVSIPSVMVTWEAGNFLRNVSQIFPNNHMTLSSPENYQVNDLIPFADIQNQAITNFNIQIILKFPENWIELGFQMVVKKMVEDLESNGISINRELLYKYINGDGESTNSSTEENFCSGETCEMAPKKADSSVTKSLGKALRKILVDTNKEKEQL